MPAPPAGTITFVFTDIEGSTRLWDQHREDIQLALARHDAILRETIEQHSGYIFKTVGDAFCAAFGSAADALNAAVAIQCALAEEDWPGEITALRVRMAVHTGIAEERDGDYLGRLSTARRRSCCATCCRSASISAIWAATASKTSSARSTSSRCARRGCSQGWQMRLSRSAGPLLDKPVLLQPARQLLFAGLGDHAAAVRAARGGGRTHPPPASPRAARGGGRRPEGGETCERACWLDGIMRAIGAVAEWQTPRT